MWPQHKVWSSLAVTSGDVWGPGAASLISLVSDTLVTTGLSRLSQHLRLRPFISLSGFLLVSGGQYWPLIGQMSLMSQQCHITQCHTELTLLSIRHENLIDTNWCIDSDHRLSHERSGPNIPFDLPQNLMLCSLLFETWRFLLKGKFDVYNERVTKIINFWRSSDSNKDFNWKQINIRGIDIVGGLSPSLINLPLSAGPRINGASCVQPHVVISPSWCQARGLWCPRGTLLTSPDVSVTSRRLDSSWHGGHFTT